MKKKILIIIADTNDGDYVTSNNEITDLELQVIKPVIDAIKSFKPYQGEWMPGQFTTHEHNFPFGDGMYVPRKDMGEKSSRDLYGHLGGYRDFERLCPYGDNGIHSIDSIKIIEVDQETVLI